LSAELERLQDVFNAKLDEKIKEEDDGIGTHGPMYRRARAAVESTVGKANTDWYGKVRIAMDTLASHSTWTVCCCRRRRRRCRCCRRPALTGGRRVPTIRNRRHLRRSPCLWRHWLRPHLGCRKTRRRGREGTLLKRARRPPSRKTERE
jgi:hypothetical protein